MTLVDRGGLVGTREYQMNLQLSSGMILNSSFGFLVSVVFFFTTSTLCYILTSLAALAKPYLQVKLGNSSRGGGDWAAVLEVPLVANAPSALLNTWSHVAFTYNGTSAQLSVYLNGNLVGVQLASPAPAFQTATEAFGLSEVASNYSYPATYDFTPSSPSYLRLLANHWMAIGAAQASCTGTTTTYSAHFTGRMDQLHIFDAPLSSQQVRDFSLLPLNRTGEYPHYLPSLRAYYAFDEGTPLALSNFQQQLLHIQDWTVNENHGSLIGAHLINSLCTLICVLIQLLQSFLRRHLCMAITLQFAIRCERVWLCGYRSSHPAIRNFNAAYACFCSGWRFDCHPDRFADPRHTIRV
jgi:hypothetical protein